MVRNLNVPFEDAEYDELKEQKDAMQLKLERTELSWHDFLLKRLAIGFIDAEGKRQ